MDVISLYFFIKHLAILYSLNATERIALYSIYMYMHVTVILFVSAKHKRSYRKYPLFLYTVWVFLSYENVIIVGEGLQSLSYARHPWSCGIGAGRDLYRATPAVTRSLGLSSLTWRTAPLVTSDDKQCRGNRGSVLVSISTGLVYLLNLPLAYIS